MQIVPPDQSKMFPRHAPNRDKLPRNGLDWNLASLAITGQGLVNAIRDRSAMMAADVARSPGAEACTGTGMQDADGGPGGDRQRVGMARNVPPEQWLHHAGRR